MEQKVRSEKRKVPKFKTIKQVPDDDKNHWLANCSSGANLWIQV